MYDNHLAPACAARRAAFVTAVAAALAISGSSAGPARAQVTQFEPSSVVKRVSGMSEKLEMTTNSSRILTLDKPIPRIQINNPELLAATALSATEVQISAKKAGVT